MRFFVYITAIMDMIKKDEEQLCNGMNELDVGLQHRQVKDVVLETARDCFLF